MEEQYTLNDIYNDGYLTFGDGTTTMTGGIQGTGYTTVDGATVITESTGKIQQSSITVRSGKLENGGEVTTTGEGIAINDGATLVTHGKVDTYTQNSDGKITNNGTFEVALEGEYASIKSGNKIEGTGDFVVTSGKFVNYDEDNDVLGNINQKNIEINSGAAIVSSVTTITASEGISNAGTLTLNGEGTNTNKISGEGETVIDGEVVNEAQIEQSKVTVNENKKLTSNADNMKAEVANSGEYNITGGTVSYKVTGNNGIININDDEVTIAKDIENNNINLGTTLKVKKEEYLANTSTLTIGNGATLDLQNGEAGTVGAGVKITENGAAWNLKLDVDLDTLTADQLDVIEAVAENSQALITDVGFIGDATNLKAENTVQITTTNNINGTTNT